MNMAPTSSSPHAFTRNQVWDTSVEMVASAMMLVSIAEGQSTHTGYQGGSPTGGLYRGWGSCLSRATCKNNLSLLGSGSTMNTLDDEGEDDCYPKMEISNETADGWGFFVDGP